MAVVALRGRRADPAASRPIPSPDRACAPMTEDPLLGGRGVGIDPGSPRPPDQRSTMIRRPRGRQDLPERRSATAAAPR
jgi:hypothetical protein